MNDDDTVLRPRSLLGAARDRQTSDEASERRKFTQRMPESLVADIDEFAERRGMSRNAAINVLAKEGLDSF